MHGKLLKPNADAQCCIRNQIACRVITHVDSRRCRPLRLLLAAAPAQTYELHEDGFGKSLNELTDWLIDLTHFR